MAFVVCKKSFYFFFFTLYGYLFFFAVYAFNVYFAHREVGIGNAVDPPVVEYVAVDGLVAVLKLG